MSNLMRRRQVVAILAAMAGVLATSAPAFAHAIMSPPVAQAKVLQQFTLSVPTEKEGATTTKIVLTVPDGFAVDSYEDAPGWKRTVAATGSGDSAVVNTITWSGGKHADRGRLGLPPQRRRHLDRNAHVQRAPVLLRWLGRRLDRARELGHARSDRARRVGPRRRRARAR